MKVRKGFIATGSFLLIVLSTSPAWGQQFTFDWCGLSRGAGSSTSRLAAEAKRIVLSTQSLKRVDAGNKRSSRCPAGDLSAQRDFDPTEPVAVRGLHSHTPSVQTPAPAEPDAGELAKKLSNPVASLISIPFQSNFDFKMGTGSGWRYTMNFQPVLPISLSPKWNMISRTIVPIIHQSNVSSAGKSESGIGDITQSLFFSPAEPKRFIWAVGPVFLIPTATNDLLGTEKFGLGPTFLILKQDHGWTYGALTNHIWSVAGSDTRADVNSTFLQPILSYNTLDGWTYGLNAETSYDWVGNHWSVPIHASVSKLIKFGKHPVSIGGGMRCWANSPPGGPGGCGLRFIVTPLIPK